VVFADRTEHGPATVSIKINRSGHLKARHTEAKDLPVTVSIKINRSGRVVFADRTEHGPATVSIKINRSGHLKARHTEAKDLRPGGGRLTAILPKS
jgi:hypothetical protein